MTHAGGSISVCSWRAVVRLRAGRRSFVTAPPLLAVILLASLPASAGAQQYRSDPVNRLARNNAGAAAICVQNQAAYQNDKDRFAEYFNKYYFPAMTRWEDADLGELGTLRYNLFRRYLWPSNVDQLQRDLTELTYKAMGRIVVANDPPYHPAVRYNAVLTLGLLDAQYARGDQPPRPLPGANKALTQIVTLGITKDRFPPPVILGALIGLERHAQYRESLAPEAIAAMTNAALQIVNRQERLPDTDRDVFAWIQLRAASVLARLGSVGENGQAHNGLMALVAGDLPLDDRCHIAGLLKNISYAGATADGQATVNGLRQLVLDTCADADRLAKEYEELSVGVGGGRRYGGGEPEELNRRLLLTRMVNLRSALTAVEPVLPETAKPAFATIAAEFDRAINTATDDEVIDLEVARTIREMVDAVEEAARGITSSTDDAAEAT